MPRWYSDGYPAPPEDRGGGAIFIFLLALSVAGIMIGAGWLSLNAIGGPNRAGAPAAATPLAAQSAAPTALPAATAIPTPTALPRVIAAPDWEIPKGHFFTQTNGAPPLTSSRGFTVTNEAGMPFWDEFRRLGGSALVGYPLSGRFQWQGRVTQVFQRAVLQWNPAAYRVQPFNIMDELHAQDKDQWLLKTHSTPVPLSPEFDARVTPAEAVRNRLSLLDLDPAMQAFYRAAPDALALYGLPASLIDDMGDHYALRTQRNVLQRWQIDRPWARAGQVTAANSGQLAVDAGIFPPEPFQSQPPPTS